MKIENYSCQCCGENFNDDKFGGEVHEKYCLKNPEFIASIPIPNSHSIGINQNKLDGLITC